MVVWISYEQFNRNNNSITHTHTHRRVSRSCLCASHVRPNRATLSTNHVPTLSNLAHFLLPKASFLFRSSCMYNCFPAGPACFNWFRAIPLIFCREDDWSGKAHRRCVADGQQAHSLEWLGHWLVGPFGNLMYPLYSRFQISWRENWRGTRTWLVLITF